jgi:hypothetical protein
VVCIKRDGTGGTKAATLSMEPKDVENVEGGFLWRSEVFERLVLIWVCGPHLFGFRG